MSFKFTAGCCDVAADVFCFRYLALSQDEEILISPDMEAAAGL